MKRLAFAAVIGAAFASGAWGQAPPPGTYVFVSGPGVGTPPFTVSGFNTSLGGSIGGIHLPNCSGLHVHGTFNGFADPNSGGCGHGIIALLVAPPPVSGGGLPGGMPTNIAGQLALTTPNSPPGLPISQAGDAFLLALAGFAYKEQATLGDNWSTGMVLTTLLTSPGVDIKVQIPNFAAAIEKAATPGRGAASPGQALQTTLADPAQRVLSSPAATSWLEEFAAHDDRTADGYRRDADKTQQQADEWRKLADDARRDAERNRQRADDARRDGRGDDAKNWDEEAQRDRAEAERRERESERLGGWSDEMRQREDAARAQARERRDAAERAREQVRQAERDRVERVRQQAEEKARLAREERDARRAKEQAERDARIQELQDRVRAREVEAARQRAAAEREYRQWLAEQQAQRNARARGGSTDADAAAAAARKKKQEEEEKTWADYVIAFFDSGEGEVATDKVKDMMKDKLKDELLKRSGITGKLDDLGLSDAAGKLGEGIDEFNKVRKVGEALDEQMRLLPGRQQRVIDKMDALESRQATGRDLRSGSLAWREALDTVVPIIKASQ